MYITVRITIIGLVILFCSAFPLLAAVASPYDQVLKEGMTGESVRYLQVKLKDYGFYQGEIDGQFGTDTVAAVISFQLSNGLYPDGVVGFTTLKILHDYRSADITANRQSEGSHKGRQIAAFSVRYLGVPYAWAGRSPTGFDCSGFVYYVFSNHGIALPRMADEQFRVGLPININELQIGDLVFFNTYDLGPSHVGIFIGNGYFIHASSGAEMVTITPLSKPYYQERFLGARRVIR